MRIKFRLAAAAVTAMALALAGCGGGGSPQAVVPPPTPYETAKAAIMAAATMAAAQEAYDAVKDDVTAAEGEKLKMAVEEREAMLATMARIAAQKMALMDAAGMIDVSDLSTQEMVDAAGAAIAGLRQALSDAADVSDADKAMYMSRLDAAVAALNMAQGGIDTATRRTNQRAALEGASMRLQAALVALFGATPTQAQLDAANAARTALDGAIAGAADLTETEKALHQGEADTAMGLIGTARIAFDSARDAAKAARDKAMAKLARAMHKALTANPLNLIEGAGAAVIPAIARSLGACNPNCGASAGWLGSGWKGASSAETDFDTMVTNKVQVYTNQGVTFGEAYGGSTYTASTRTFDVGDAPDRKIRSPAFPKKGTKTFTGAQSVRGTYEGAPGVYECSASASAICTAKHTAGGIVLSAPWTFVHDRGAIVSRPDANYLFFGWWTREDQDGPTHASAYRHFAGNLGTMDHAALFGTATYIGGAVGSYALRSDIGGTNDAGHFTARATLDADFTAETVSGTIDNFTGADGQARNWSVELKEGRIHDTGDLARNAANDTVWTIDGTAVAASGEWEAQFGHEVNLVPTVVGGTFFTTYGHEGRMVGAFGASKQ